MQYSIDQYIHTRMSPTVSSRTEYVWRMGIQSYLVQEYKVLARSCYQGTRTVVVVRVLVCRNRARMSVCIYIVVRVESMHRLWLFNRHRLGFCHLWWRYIRYQNSRALQLVPYRYMYGYHGTTACSKGRANSTLCCQFQSRTACAETACL